MGTAAAIGRQFAKSYLPQAVNRHLSARKVCRNQPCQLRLKKILIQRLWLRARSESDPPFARPVVRLHRLPAAGFPQPADQMPGGVPTGMQPPLFAINLHAHRPCGQRLGGEMQHLVALLRHA